MDAALTTPLVLRGAFGSPYSLKMRAVLRYRRIPFRWVPRGSRWDDLPEVPVQIIPAIGFPDGRGGYLDAMVDSSPQIDRLEREHAGRSLTPFDPAVAFLDRLVEDFGDEWMTKAMYHYRWTYDADIAKAGSLLPIDSGLQLDDDDHLAARGVITDRQVGRRPLVGSTEQNLPVIEGSYERVLDVLHRHLAAQDFLFGARPGRGDFGLFGQLSQLVAWDPTPAAVAVNRAPRVVTWTSRMDDLSWWEVDGEAGWASADRLAPTVHDLLHEVGSTYAPFLLANAAALESGAAEVVCTIRGSEYRQAPFGYQGKCLRWLREAHAALDAPSRTTVDALLAGTGCDALFR